MKRCFFKTFYLLLLKCLSVVITYPIQGCPTVTTLLSTIYLSLTGYQPLPQMLLHNGLAKQQDEAADSDNGSGRKEALS
jgi:hypothetical protein